MTVTPLVSDSQWSAADIQLINWGGFQGHHRVSFALGCTLLTGASGSGKSTLLDAVIADLMPHTVPFNGASNETVGGPVRGGQQRSVVTYLRGKKDTAADGDDGRLTDKVLRGIGEPTWGAVAAGFVNSDRRRFTVLRTYWVPTGATGKGDITERRFTVPGDFDLRDIVGLQDGGFPPEQMKARFAGMKHYTSYNEFRQAFCTRLGIGQADSGEKALRLLARIQAAHPFQTVDHLYKQTVLEDPDTLAKADQCLAHFGTLDTAYRDLETAEKKEEALRPIHELHTRWQTATCIADRIDTFGATRPSATTPFRVWQLRHRRRLLDIAEGQLKEDLATTTSEFEDAKSRVADLKERRGELEQARRDNGGDLVGVIEGRIEVARSNLSTAQRRLDLLLEKTGDLGGGQGIALTTREAFDKASAEARGFTAGYVAEHVKRTDQRDDLVEQRPAMAAGITALKEELRSLAERDGLVPKDVHEARKQIAAACGLKVTDLPFAAELMDVDQRHDQWRLAAELTLRGVGLTMLVDERREDQMRRSINNLKLGRRINFDGVALGAPSKAQPDAAYISGKLVFKESSPFIAWVKERVTRDGTDHLCVPDPSLLGGPIPKVTAAGQTSHGRRGAHGRNPDQRPILGFSNEARKDEVRTEIKELELEQARVAGGIKQLDAHLKQLDRLNAAHKAVLAAEWDLIDVAGLSAEVGKFEQQRNELLANNSILTVLTKQLAQVETDLYTATGEQSAAETRKAKLEKQRADIVDLQDSTMDELDPIERDGAVTLSEVDDQFLQDKLAEQDPTVTWDKFNGAADRLRGRLGDESRRARADATTARESLEQVFRQYSQLWPDPNRGTVIDFYPDYQAIYDEIIGEGLHSRRARFKREVQQWSGDDLRLLNNSYDQSREDIDGRMDPVNRFLSAVPFGPRAEKLQIVLKDIHTPAVDAFRATLRTLSSDTTLALTDAEVHDRFQALRDFMRNLGWSEAGATKRNDDLLDVRRHVNITARRIDADGREAGVYESLAGKSGGESQELAAFIVGAALRYQLGDGDRPEPRFAPVFVDEGFVKSDWEYAGRAVQAWRSLGFQLIVSAPLDKVTGLEPHMDSAAVVTKNVERGYSFITEFPDMESWAQHQAIEAAVG